MRMSSRRVLLVAVASGGLLLGSAAPALAQDLGDVDVNELTGQLQEAVPAQEESPVQPVTDLVCQLTSNEVELLGQCPGEVATPPPVAEEKPKPSKPVGDKGHAGKGVGDVGDKGAAPVGGVETGAGGTADDGAGLLLPLGLLGGAGLAGGAAVVIRRLYADQAH